MSSGSNVPVAEGSVHVPAGGEGRQRRIVESQYCSSGQPRTFAPPHALGRSHAAPGMPQPEAPHASPLAQQISGVPHAGAAPQSR
jgi:hypothetical protein